MGVLLFPRPSGSSDRVGISRSIRINFAVVKHCPHIGLKVFDGFQLLVHLQTTKKRITPRCSSLVHTESGAAILLCHSAKLNSVMMLKLSTSGDKGAIRLHARAESSTTNPQNIKTPVRILTDLPSYHDSVLHLEGDTQICTEFHQCLVLL